MFFRSIIVLSCTCSFAGCFNDSCGSGRAGNENKIIIETDGRVIKMNVEFKNKVNEQTILPFGFSWVGL